MSESAPITVPDVFVYAERADHDPASLERAVRSARAPFAHVLSRLWSGRVRGLIADVAAEDYAATPEQHDQARRGLRREGFTTAALGKVLPLVCAAVRQTVSRDTSDGVLRGAVAMLHGRIAEIEDTSERQLAITIAAACAALAGKPVHVLAPDDARAAQLADIARPIYDALGLSVGVIEALSAAEERHDAYECDIVHVAAQQVAFDHLRDRILLGTRRSNLELKISRAFAVNRRLALGNLAGREQPSGEGLRLRGLSFAIIDEADTVLLENALMPLVITREVGRDTAALMTRQAFEIAHALSIETDYTVDTDEYRIDLSEQGCARVHALSGPFGGSWRVAVQREEMVRQALIAQTLLERGVHYDVDDNALQIKDAVLNHLIAQPHIGDGLRQMIEAKEGIALSGRKVPAARSAYARVFMRYAHLCGATQTTYGAARELWRTYCLAVVRTTPDSYVSPPRRIVPDADTHMAGIVERTRTLGDAGSAIVIAARSTDGAEHIAEALSNAQIAHEVLGAAADNDAAPGDLGRANVVVLSDLATWLSRGSEQGSAGVGRVHIIMAECQPLRRTERRIVAAARAVQGDAPSSDASGLEYLLSREDPLLTPLRTHVLGSVLDGLARLREDWWDALVFPLAQIMTERKAAQQRAELLSMDTRMKRTLAISGQME